MISKLGLISVRRNDERWEKFAGLAPGGTVIKKDLKTYVPPGRLSIGDVRPTARDGKTG